MKPGLEEKMRELVVRESALTAIDEWSTVLNNLKTPPFNYRGDHIVQAVNVAKQLAKETSADLDVVVMATWLHDCAAPGTVGPPGMTGTSHGETCAKKAREFLLNEGIDQACVDRVCDAIIKHGGRTLIEPIEPLEAQIVWEADKLTKLGLTAIIHHIINGVRYEPNNSMEGILKRVRKVMPILGRIAASMKTEPGKRMAKNRIRNNKEFIDRLEKELLLV